MVSVGIGRRAFVEALVAFPFGEAALSAQAANRPVVKVAAGSGRANGIIKLLRQWLRGGQGAGTPAVWHRECWTAAEAVMVLVEAR